MAQNIVIYAALATPANAAFSTETTGGTLAAGTYFYRVSAIDSTGGETLASAETSLATALLETPVNAAFSTATTGGTLAEGTYSYRVAAKNSFGRTLASTATTQATTGATSTVTVNWGAVTGATGYDVFGRVGGSELLIASVGAVTTYTDDGSVTPAGALPASNTTGTNTNTLTVNWGTVSGATGYKVYGRTTGAELLIATVGAVTTYTDTGSITPAGALPSANTTGSGRVKSTSISVPSNSSYTFGIYVDSGSLKPGQRAVLYVDTPGADTVETELDYSKPHQSIIGPTKIVMERVEASAPFACYYQDS